MKLNRRHKIILMIGILAIILVALVVFNYHYVWHLLTHPFINRATLLHELRRHGFLAIIPLTLLLVAASVIPGAPVSVIAIVSGLCLGAPLGFLANVLGMSLGNMIGASFINQLISKQHSEKSSRILADLLKLRHPRVGLTLAYTVPFIPNALVHLAADKLKLSRKQLLPLIVMGACPTAFFYAFGGDAVLHLNYPKLVITVVILGASAGLIWLIRRDRKKTSLT